MTDLKEIDTNEVVYCVNQESKGMVIGLYLKMVYTYMKLTKMAIK